MRYPTCSPLLICRGVGDLRTPHYGSYTRDRRYIYLALFWCMHNIVWIQQYHEIYSSFLFSWMLHSICLFYIASYSTRLAYILVSCCFNMISLVGMQLSLRYYHAFSNRQFKGGVHSPINFGNWIRKFYNASF
jgi:hypothetical protein